MDELNLECVRFGARLRIVRRERGLSQEELALRAGLDRTYVSSCEAGRRNVTLKTIVRLASALDLRPVDLLEDGLPHAAEAPAPWVPEGPRR